MSVATWGFFGNISPEDADKLLQDEGNHGSFLCRRSGSRPGEYNLSVRRRNVIWHFKIRHDGDAFSMYSGDDNDSFGSMAELVDYFMLNPELLKDADGEIIELLSPMIPQDEEIRVLEKEKFYYGDIGLSDAKEVLLHRGEHGSYLVRDSRSKPGMYVLSVRRATECKEFLIKHENKVFSIASADALSFPTLKQLLVHFKEKPLVDTSNNVVVLNEPLRETEERLMNQQRIKLEFEALQQEDRANTSSKNEGLRPENKTKNRYKNILPFDHTRVVLRDAIPDMVGDDYINASYVFDAESGALFIASQGCMKQTVDSFWRMVYQDHTRVIIMVTNEYEKGKMKCVRYWPDPHQSREVGGRIVRNVGEVPNPHYIVRQLEISEDAEPGQKTSWRTIYHYQCTGWPDHGVPQEPGMILEMMQQIEATTLTLNSPGPPIIHCSAGIGRTGTLIVISMLMSLVRIKGQIEEQDVRQTVQAVRLQRSGMVQTVAQYHFIYNALKYFVDQLTARYDAGAGSSNDYLNMDPLSEHMEKLVTNTEERREASKPKPPPKGSKPSMRR